MLPLLAKAAKKQKKVWIAFRHASLAVAMTGARIAFFMQPAGAIPAKVEPV